jgi:hypothetical protein
VIRKIPVLLVVFALLSYGPTAEIAEWEVQADSFEMAYAYIDSILVLENELNRVSAPATIVGRSNGNPVLEVVVTNGPCWNMRRERAFLNTI